MGTYRSGGDANIVKDTSGELTSAVTDSLSKLAKLKEKQEDDDLAINSEFEDSMVTKKAPITKRLTKKKGKYNCWTGYERVPGTKKGEKGSCRKKGKK